MRKKWLYYVQLIIVYLYTRLYLGKMSNRGLEVWFNGREKDFVGGNKKTAKILQISGRTYRVWCAENIV